MVRGQLRIYVGAATGVGTSHAMLAEGLRRRRDGATVVLACLDAHGRVATEAMARRLTPAPPAALDVAAVLAARPDVALVDDVGRRGPDGRRRADDVGRLLDAGVDVVSTLSIDQIATVADAAGAITGVPIADPAPDELLATAEIELVDATPETMRDRIARGDVLPATAADVALYNGPAYAALRALAASWLADRLAAAPGASRHARERVVVAVSDGAGSDTVVRRAARLAQRSHAQLVGVRVRRPGADEDLRTLADRRRLVVELGGDYQEVESAAIADALVSFARAEDAGQLVLGATPSGRRRRRRAGSVVTDVLARADDIDVHVVPRPDARAGPTRWPWSRESPISHGRRVAGFVGGAALLVALTWLLVAIRDHVSVSTAMSLQLLAVALIAAVGGLGPGLAAAVAAPLLVNWFLIPPYHTLRIGDTENLVSLLVFMSVAALVSAFVSTAARRAAEAERLRDEAHTLASLVGVGGPDPMGAIAAHLVDSFHLDGVAVFRVDGGGAGTVVEATAGARPPATIDEATFHRLVGHDVVLAGAGPPLTSEDDRVLRSFLQQLERALEQRRLAAVAADAEALSQADALRTSLLRAVSHDLRTPLANVKAAVSSLRQRDVEWSDDDREDFLEAIEVDTDRLTAIITNLLDLSKLQAGAMRPAMQPTSLDEVVASALHQLGPSAGGVQLDMAREADEVVADPALLERVVANLVANALDWSPPGAEVRVAARRAGDQVQLHVVDHGPGIPATYRTAVVQPFHRLDDASTGGLGLGLAIADQMTAAMGGGLELWDTPGGGLTAVVSLGSP